MNIDDRPTDDRPQGQFKHCAKISNDHNSATRQPIPFMFGSSRVFGDGGSNSAISGSIKSKMAAGGHLGKLHLQTSLTCHPGRDSDRLLPVNLLSRRSTFPPSENGLFQFPVPTSGTVFHHTLHVHRRSRYSGSVSRHFSSTCHIRT